MLKACSHYFLEDGQITPFTLLLVALVLPLFLESWWWSLLMAWISLVCLFATTAYPPSDEPLTALRDTHYTLSYQVDPCAPNNEREARQQKKAWTRVSRKELATLLQDGEIRVRETWDLTLDTVRQACCARCFSDLPDWGHFLTHYYLCAGCVVEVTRDFVETRYLALRGTAALPREAWLLIARSMVQLCLYCATRCGGMESFI